MEKLSLESTSLFTGILSAVGASVCCTLPFALVSIGVGGAWMSQLRVFERFFPVFVLLALIAFSVGFYRLYLRRVECAPGEVCAVPESQRRQRIAFWIGLVIAIAFLTFPFIYAPLTA